MGTWWLASLSPGVRELLPFLPLVKSLHFLSPYWPPPCRPLFKVTWEVFVKQEKRNKDGKAVAQLQSALRDEVDSRWGGCVGDGGRRLVRDKGALRSGAPGVFKK